MIFLFLVQTLFGVRLWKAIQVHNLKLLKLMTFPDLKL